MKKVYSLLAVSFTITNAPIFLQINHILKQISNLKIHLSFINIELVDLEWIATSLSLKAPGKEELSFIMEFTGEAFLIVQILT